MPDHSHRLQQLVEKALIRRGMRGASCRVFPPGSGGRAYSVILEENRVREQFFVNPADVDEFIRTGNEQFVLQEIRFGVRNLDRMAKKKTTARRAD